MSNKTEAQLLHGYWVIETNKWNASIYTKDQAEKYADTLINCTDCIDCSNCSSCSYCSDCIGCSGCSDCSSCIYCRYCSNCSSCSYCSYCSRCSGCSDCSSCIYCRYCSNCSSCSYCSRCSDCSYCSYCSRCSDCSDCSSCSGFKYNPERITSPKIGSRHQHTTYYWIKDYEQIVCGCFKGTLEEFEKAVEEKHGDNQHGIDYKNWIVRVKLYKEVTNDTKRMA